MGFGYTRYGGASLNIFDYRKREDMGTDIHLRVQEREGGTWKWADGIRERYDHDDDRMPWFHQRSYDTFAILADVRNGTGFAGVDTGDGFVPISKPKGVPDDLKMIYADEERSWKESTNEDETWTIGIGEHSHSWLTVKELVEYDWSQVTYRRGILSLKEYWRFSERQKWAYNDLYPQPKEWSGSIQGPSIVVVEAGDADKIIRNMNVESWRDLPDDRRFARMRSMGVSYHVRHSWPVMYSQAAQVFYLFCMPRLMKLANDVGSYEDVRIVFGFDS